MPWTLRGLLRRENPRRGLQAPWLLFGLALFVPLAIWQVRWEPYAELFLVLLLAPLLGWRPTVRGVGPVRLGVCRRSARAAGSDVGRAPGPGDGRARGQRKAGRSAGRRRGL